MKCSATTQFDSSIQFRLCLLAHIPGPPRYRSASWCSPVKIGLFNAFDENALNNTEDTTTFSRLFLSGICGRVSSTGCDLIPSVWVVTDRSRFQTTFLKAQSGRWKGRMLGLRLYLCSRRAVVSVRGSIPGYATIDGGMALPKGHRTAKPSRVELGRIWREGQHNTSGHRRCASPRAVGCLWGAEVHYGGSGSGQRGASVL